MYMLSIDCTEVVLRVLVVSVMYGDTPAKGVI